MADAFGQMILLERFRQVGGDGQRRLGLADARDVVALAFDREDADVGDRARIDLAAAMQHLALGKGVRLEHHRDGLEVEFGGHVADRAIFLVELHRRIGALVVALDEMLEHLPMRDEVVAEVHRHETGELQEAGVHLPARAGIAHRHGGDDVLLEPAERALGRQRVDRGGRLARVDRAAHHGERARAVRVLVRAHQCGGGVAGHRRLAHREHVRPRIALGTDMREKLDHIVDIVVEVELALAGRHQLRVAPIGDVDIRHRQHPLHRAAQQRGIVAGHRRHDQQLRTAFHALAHEALELAERLAEHDFLMHLDLTAVDLGEVEREGRLAARRGGMGENFERGGHHRPAAEIGERIGRIVEQARAEIGQGTCPGKHRTLNLVGVVQHQKSFPVPRSLQRGLSYHPYRRRPCAPQRRSYAEPR